MKQTMLRRYARLIARMGVNVQPGQEVFITAGLDQPEFVKLLVEECYKCKAKKVVVDFSYQPLEKLHYRYRSQKVLGQMAEYEEARWKHYAQELPCRYTKDTFGRIKHHFINPQVIKGFLQVINQCLLPP